MHLLHCHSKAGQAQPVDSENDCPWPEPKSRLSQRRRYKECKACIKAPSRDSRNDKRQPFRSCLFIPCSKHSQKSGRFRRNPRKASLEQLLTWCGRRDSNSHALRRWNLNPVCLPIPPRPRIKLSNKNARLLAWRFGTWGGRWESNPRHQEPQSCALPTELRPPYCACCILLVPKLPSGTPGRTRTCDHPLRRRMLYPAELRAPIHLQADSKLSAPAELLQALRLPSYPATGCARQAGRML